MFHQKPRLGLLLGILGMLIAGMTAAQSRANAAPVNDDFANATVITGKSSTGIAGTNVGATKETNEPNPGPYSYSCQGDSVWYRWKAPANGGVTFTATGNFNSVLGIYTGLYVDKLTSQTEFQPGLGTEVSSATFNAVAETTYYILIDDYEGAIGTFTLTSTWGPANDNFADATVLSGATGSIAGTNIDSSREPGEPNPGPYSYSCQGRSVWYRWKAPASRDITFTATGDFNSVLGIYTRSTTGTLTNQTASQPGLGTDISSATLNAVAHTIYYILVDDYEGDTGSFTLTWH